MAINGLNLFTDKFRIGGLATGLDTDQMVSDLMRVERFPLDRLYQKRQLTEWKRDDYRDIINLLRGLKDECFNNLKMSSNMLLQSSFRKFTGTSSINEYVTVSGGPALSEASHTISVYKMATADKAISSTGVTSLLEGAVVKNYELSGKKIRITLDGVTREITLDNYDHLAGPSDIVTKENTGLQALVDKAFGTGKIQVGYDEGTGKLSFASTGGASRITLSSGSTNDGLSDLGFLQGASNRIDINKSLDYLKDRFASSLTFNAEGKLKFKINGKAFEFDKSTTLSNMMNTINSDPDAKVHMQYDEVTDKFILTSKELGTGDNIVIDAAYQEGNFFGIGGASGILAGSAVTDHGADAEVKINGVMIKRSSNTFTVNGVTFNILKVHENPDTQSETVSLTLDVDGIYENIKNFVDKYNELLSKINEKLSEKYDRNYQPLTKEQKDVMKEGDIEKWEEIAKKGLLRNDPMLQNIVNSLRRAMFDKIDGVSENLSSIGINTGSYMEKGKLIIDETKLKNAIRNDHESVMNLFSKKSDIASNIDLTAEERAKRYNEEGLAYRIFDIVENNIRTIRDKDGKKGILLETAGLIGDASEFTNSLYREIGRYDIKIDELTAKLISKENGYYQKFTAMEKAIARMNAQSDWLLSQFNYNF